MSVVDPRSDPDFQLAVAQGRVLLAIADLQFVNLRSAATLASVVFARGGQIIITGRKPDGTEHSVSLPSRPQPAQRDAIAGLLGWSTAPSLPGPPRWPSSPQERLADLLRDLGSNVDALVLYRADVPPLRFAAIRFDDAGCDIVLADPSGNEVPARCTWGPDPDLATGELYAIVDQVADRMRRCGQPGTPGLPAAHGADPMASGAAARGWVRRWPHSTGDGWRHVRDWPDRFRAAHPKRAWLLAAGAVLLVPVALLAYANPWNLTVLQDQPLPRGWWLAAAILLPAAAAILVIPPLDKMRSPKTLLLIPAWLVLTVACCSSAFLVQTSAFNARHDHTLVEVAHSAGGRYEVRVSRRSAGADDWVWDVVVERRSRLRFRPVYAGCLYSRQAIFRSVTSIEPGHLTVATDHAPIDIRFDPQTMRLTTRIPAGLCGDYDWG